MSGGPLAAFIATQAAVCLASVALGWSLRGRHQFDYARFWRDRYQAARIEIERLDPGAPADMAAATTSSVARMIGGQ